MSEENSEHVILHHSSVTMGAGVIDFMLSRFSPQVDRTPSSSINSKLDDAASASPSASSFSTDSIKRSRTSFSVPNIISGEIARAQNINNKSDVSSSSDNCNANVNDIDNTSRGLLPKNFHADFEKFVDCFVESIVSKRSLQKTIKLRSQKEIQDNKRKEQDTQRSKMKSLNLVNPDSNNPENIRPLATAQEEPIKNISADDFLAVDRSDSQDVTDPFFKNGRCTRLEPVKRLVAIGDLHGDIDKARCAFQAGGLIDEKDNWVGGQTVAVQVGDQLDRGSNELEILYWLNRLQVEAKDAGGALHVVNGNHEVMSIAGDFR